jgi:hypothetical protein
MPDAPIVPPTEEAHGAIGSNPPNAPVNTTPRLHQIHPPVLATALDLLGRFVSSGVFFMIIGAVLLRTAYETIGTTHSAMSLSLSLRASPSCYLAQARKVSDDWTQAKTLLALLSTRLRSQAAPA